MLTRERLYDLWYDATKTNTQVAGELGITLVRLWQLGRAYSLPARRTRLLTPDPTIDEIRERADAIKATWSDEERAKRFVGRGRREWTPPAFMFTSSGHLVASDR